MHIISDFNNDIRSLKKQPGGYEWWYFDAADEHGTYRLVIVFYEGNPFSTRYIQALETKYLSEETLPEQFPAISISVCKDSVPVYYSFTEFNKEDTEFASDIPRLRVGSHRMAGCIEEGKLVFNLKLEETLPTGDALQGELTFKSPHIKHPLFNYPDDADNAHSWNLTQPRAEVSGRIKLSSGSENHEVVKFKGTGYHDHNIGREPMRNEFKDWYWGRFHFEQGTLVYYMMNRKTRQQRRAWLISRDNGRILQRFDKILLEDKSLTRFGLNVARRIILDNEEAQATIQQTRVMDNGPFYQRFDSDAFLVVQGGSVPETSSGISEYLRPERIYRRMFWPLVNMRIRFNGKPPHWVQKSKILYRWTW